MAHRHLPAACVVTAGLLAFLTGPAGAAPGDLDETFGVGGRVVLQLGAYDVTSRASIIQPDGKVVLAGSGPYAEVGNEDFFVVRLNQDGSLDQSFGSGGIVRTPIDLDPDARDIARDVALGPDGTIVVVGEATEPQSTGDSDLAFVRYTPAGALDSRFSDDGIQTIDLGSRDIGYGVAIQPSDGKIVAVGTHEGLVGFETLRLQTDGSLDDSFGTGGVVDTNIGSESVHDTSRDVVLDGQAIVVTGVADDNTAYDLGLVRYLANGALDPSFGSGGIAVTPGPDIEVISSTALLPGGKILTAGSARNFQTGDKFILARYLASGELDPTFGGNGVVVTPIGTDSGVSDLAVQVDGKAIAGGWATTDGPRFALARYNDNGSLDSSFGAGGIRLYPVGEHGGDGWSVVIQHLDDGRVRLVEGGTAWEVPGGTFAAIGIRLDGPPPPVPPPPPPPPSPLPPVPPPPPQRICVVPNVVGQTLRRARTRIRSRRCVVGRIRRVRSRRARGLVVRQNPRAGARRRQGARVSLVVSRGRR